MRANIAPLHLKEVSFPGLVLAHPLGTVVVVFLSHFDNRLKRILRSLVDVF